jgi:hypothetical protein
MTEDAIKEFGKNVPMKRPGQPAELATAYVMLADPLSSCLSGATIAVTGGKPILQILLLSARDPTVLRKAGGTLSPVTRFGWVNTSKPSCRATAISVIPAASQARSASAVGADTPTMMGCR